MYRTLIPLLLLSVVSAAPQDAAITYIQVQPNIDELDPAPSYRASRIENIPSSIPEILEKTIEADILETSNENDGRNVRAEPTTEVTEITEALTENVEALTKRNEALTEKTEAVTERSEVITERYEAKTTPYEVKTKPKFYSKLSYFEKPKFDSVLTNLIERPGRRKFRSRCRCERISNCPKLQITVPRCPEEQFMCCF